MNEDFENQVSDFLGMWVGGMPEKTRFFDLNNMQGLQDEHAIPEEFLMVVLLVLEFAALGYWQETDRAKIDKKSRRKDLQNLEKATTKLVSVLDGLSPDTERVMREASIARGFLHHSPEDVVTSLVQSVMEPRSSDTETSNYEVNDEGKFGRLRTDLEAIADEARKAQKWVGAGKPGRPDDDSAQDLMQMCFLVWTEVIGREFTLAWFKKGPDSDAARFCCDVAGIVDPQLSSSRIITASRKIRETGIGIKDLDKLFQEADDLSKRIE